jgi:toxin YhaV
VTGSPFDVRNGWRLYLHPAFREQFDGLVQEVSDLRRRHPAGYAGHPKAKLLKRLTEIILDEVPADPGAPRYRQGVTLGDAYRHWRRARFLGRFRLFFRFDSRAKVIIYAWVNDERTLRQRGARTDPYAVFRRRLASGDPPNDWDDLLKSSGG